MTIEEISKAKREVEERIQQELQQLQAATGMDVTDVNVRYLHTMEIGGFERKHVAAVGIELRVP